MNYDYSEFQDITFPADSITPTITKFYKDVDEQYHISHLDTSYFNEQIQVDGETVTRCPLLSGVWQLLCSNFELYYKYREVGGYDESDFFDIMQSCLLRNADTLERQLSVYWEDIANPVLGRTEVVTYDLKDNRVGQGSNAIAYGHRNVINRNDNTTDRHIEVPADAPTYDTDRTRDKSASTTDSTSQDSGTDTTTIKSQDDKATTGTVTTKLSDVGVTLNYERLNGFLDKNRTFIQEFINLFEECFIPRYRRVMW